MSSYTCCDQIWSMNTEQQSELKVFLSSIPARRMDEKNLLPANLSQAEILTASPTQASPTASSNTSQNLFEETVQK